MHNLRNWIIALAAVAVWIVPARPADTDPNKEKRQQLVAEEGAIELILLRQKSVQDDLKIGEDEAKKIHEFTSEQYKKAKALETGNPDESKEKFEDLAKENRKFLHDNLSEDQHKRLRQISMQLAGLLWVTRPDVAKELNLTDEQKQKAHELQEEARKDLRDFYQAKGDAKKEEIKELHERNHKRLHDLLTDEQRAKWKEMLGEKFKGELQFGPSKPNEPPK